MGRTFSLSAFLIQAFLLPSGLQAQNPPPLPELQREHARLENEIEQLEDHSQEASVGLSSLAALEAITQQSVFLASHDAQARLGQLLERARKASTEDLDDELDTSIKNLDLAMSRDLGSLATRFQSHISSQDTGEVTLPGIVRDAVRIPGEVRQEM